MANLNKVLLIGNLTRDPQLTHTAQGLAICKFGLATNRRYVVNGETQKETTFVDIVIFGKRAESFERFMRKGSAVFIEGRLNYQQWQDKESGAKRNKLEVVCENWEFVDAAGDRAGGGGGGGGGYAETRSSGGGGYQEPDFPSDDDFGGADDNVPF